MSTNNHPVPGGHVTHLKNNNNNCIYLFLAVLSLGCCAGFSLVVESGGYSLVAVCGLLILVASLVAEHRL